MPLDAIKEYFLVRLKFELHSFGRCQLKGQIL